MNNPKITVLMPVYNAEKFLKEAIDSILKQTFNDFEFVIINDASTDNSKKIIMSYDDKRIRYFENKSNLGVAKTLNKGLRLAKGNYIARMDADDISLPHRIQFQYKRFLNYKNIVIVFTCNEVIDESGNYVGEWKEIISPEEIYYTLRFKNCLAHPTVMIKKKIILDEFNGYNEASKAEDYELWSRISKKYPIIKLNKSLIKVRTNKESKMGKFGKIVHENAFNTIRKNLQMLIKKPIDIELARIITGYYPKDPQPKNIVKALLLLNEINNKIIENYPSFLNQKEIKKIATNNILSLKIKYFVAIICHSKLFFIYKFTYQIYLKFKFFFKQIYCEIKNRKYGLN